MRAVAPVDGGALLQYERGMEGTRWAWVGSEGAQKRDPPSPHLASSELLQWARRQRERMANQRRSDCEAEAARAMEGEDAAGASSDSEYEMYGECRYERATPAEWAEWAKGIGASGTSTCGERVLSLSLCSHRKFFAARLWPAARLMARYLEYNRSISSGRRVLEVGAGAGLPSIIAALVGADRVLITDVPDERMLQNTRKNVAQNVPPDFAWRVAVHGHDWAWPPMQLRTMLDAMLRESSPASPNSPKTTGLASTKDHAHIGFDLILLSDVMYELDHEALLKLISVCLVTAGRSTTSTARERKTLDERCGMPPPQVLLSFQPHDPVQLPRQLRFFELARGSPYYFDVSPLWATRAPKMFPRVDDMSEADDEQSQRVYLFSITRAANHEAANGSKAAYPSTPFELPPLGVWCARGDKEG
eukprot:scaffold195516_cov37-Tisochrysis_lutea.AAC.1